MTRVRRDYFRLQARCPVWLVDAGRGTFSLLAGLGMVCLAAVSTSGCGGCDPQPPGTSAQGKDSKQDSAAGSNRAAEKFRDLKKKKPDYEIGELVMRLSPRVNEEDLPNENSRTRDQLQSSGQRTLGQWVTGDRASGEDDLPQRLVKPGHWTSTIQPMKSNYHDFVGRVTMALLDSDNRPLAWNDTPFTINFTRPVVLAKGRKKWVDGQLLLPGEVDKARVNWTLQQRDSLTPLRQRTLPPMIRMPPYQYFLAVLAKEPGRYGYLQVADAVRAPWEDEGDELSQRHYQVLLIDGTRPLPLPANMLAWTSLALVVWDDVDPSRLTPDQQRALVDWLHWGGRLVISGPASLATLRGSFLAPYLPATSAETRSVTRKTLREWNAYWALDAKTPLAAKAPVAPSNQAAATTRTGSESDRAQSANSQSAAADNPGQLLPAVTPWSAIALKPHPEAVEVPGTAGLFYQRRVGQGSLLVSAISLTERDLVNWSGFDSFLNGALLRRPRRRFTAGPYGGVCVNWHDYPERRLDSHFTTGVRIFAHDWGAAATRLPPPTTRPTQAVTQGARLQRFQVQADIESHGSRGRPGGMGSWSEFSAISNAARSALREAAGVRVPAASFVIVCLAIYLLVLVPLNWMVFYTLEHVEWAWIAAPIIALLGTLVVVRQAQLDIGFVRAQTELGVLELAGDYPRAHLSRYTALYTSLSTTYDLKFDDPWAVATPFPARRDDPTLAGQSPVTVNLARHQRAELQGVAISSATTRLVHSAQMVELEGPLQWRKSAQGYRQVVNRTGFDLDDCLLIRRRPDGKSPLAGCWLGRLRSGQSAVVSFRRLPAESTSLTEGALPYANQRGRAARTANPPRLNIDPLLRLACQWDTAGDSWYGKRAEYRLLARIDKPLPDCQIHPRASQIRSATLVIAHLAYGDLPVPQPDINGRRDLAVK